MQNLGTRLQTLPAESYKTEGSTNQENYDESLTNTAGKPDLQEMLHKQGNSLYNTQIMVLKQHKKHLKIMRNHEKKSL